MDCVISIVIPFYKTPQNLFIRCMESILAAELKDIEVIVVDDGSPQECRPLLDGYDDVETVRVLHIPNGGVSAARNFGVREATGKWIMFVDSDDYVETKALQEVAAYARENGGDVVLFTGGSDTAGFIRCNTTFLEPGINYAAEEGGRLRLMESALSVGQIPQGYMQFYTLGAPYSKLLRREFLLENALAFDTDVKLAEDALFSLYVYQAARSIVFVDLRLYYYVCNPESVTRRYRPGFSVDMDVFFDRVRAFMVRFHLERELERAYYARVQFEVNRCIRLEYFNGNNKDPEKRKKYLRFIAKEPYRTGLQAEYLVDKRPLKRLKLLMLRHGRIRILDALSTVHGAVVRMWN